MSNEETYQKRDLMMAEIHADVKYMKQSFDKDVTHIVNTLDKHIEDDKVVQTKIIHDIDELKVLRWKVAGAIVCAVFLINIGVKIFLK